VQGGGPGFSVFPGCQVASGSYAEDGALDGVTGVRGQWAGLDLGAVGGVNYGGREGDLFA